MRFRCIGSGRALESRSLSSGVSFTSAYAHAPWTTLAADDRFLDAACDPICAGPPPIEQLYDLERDPFEHHDLLSGPRREQPVRRLARFRKAMQRHLNLAPQYRRVLLTGAEAGQASVSNLLHDALRSLGYVELSTAPRAGAATGH